MIFCVCSLWSTVTWTSQIIPIVSDVLVMAMCNVRTPLSYLDSDYYYIVFHYSWTAEKDVVWNLGCVYIFIRWHWGLCDSWMNVSDHLSSYQYPSQHPILVFHYMQIILDLWFCYSCLDNKRKESQKCYICMLIFHK